MTFLRSVGLFILSVILFINFSTARFNTFDDLDDFRDLLLLHSKWMKCNWYTIPKEVYSLYLEKPRLIKRALANMINHGYEIFEPILIQAPCFSKQSTGNHLSDYIETRLCANISGIHYIATTVQEEHVAELAEDPFIQSLSKVVLHRQPQTFEMATIILKKECLCEKFCHADNQSLINRYPLQAGRIFKHLLRSYASAVGIDLHEKVTFFANLRRPTNGSHPSPRIWKNTKMVYRFIPDVAIHMRCSDSKTGFLPFRTYLHLIPKDMRTLYILTEDPLRFDIPRVQIVRCISIIYSLFEFLTNHFPSIDVTLFQAKEPYDDLLHLSYAKITICSVSSFCFWPALANHRKIVYFPKSNDFYLKNAKHIHIINNPNRIIINPRDPNESLAEIVVTELNRLENDYKQIELVPGITERQMRGMRDIWSRQIKQAYEIAITPPPTFNPTQYPTKRK